MAAYIKFDGVGRRSKRQGTREVERLDQVLQVVHKPGAGATGAARRRGTVMLKTSSAPSCWTSPAPRC